MSTKKKSILDADEEVIAFPVFEEGFHSGLAGTFFLIFPEIRESFPIGKRIEIGAHIVETDIKVLMPLCIGSLTEPWNPLKFEIAIKGIPTKYMSHRIAFPKMGERKIEKQLHAKWEDVIVILRESPFKFVVYEGEDEVYPETIEALKAMKELIMLPPDEQKKRIEKLCCGEEEL